MRDIDGHSSSSHIEQALGVDSRVSNLFIVCYVRRAQVAAFGSWLLLTMDFENKPYLFPIFFGGMWLFMSAFFSLIQGWWSLARRFHAAERPSGERITSQVKQMGIVPENRVTHMVLSRFGLYLYASFLFRFMHPALLIPWSRVGGPRRINTLWWSTYEYELDSRSSIRVTRRAHEAIERFRS
jgi:hypothetical protein